MSDRLTITMESAGVLDAFARLPEQLEAACFDAAGITADRIVVSARTQLNAITSGTGETAKGIHAEVSNDGKGYVVLPTFTRSLASYRARKTGRRWRQRVTTLADGKSSNLPTWLEFGTKYMRPRPFLGPAVQLEQGPHTRRIDDAITSVIDAEGLGD